jgi:hypothetical protein
VAFSATPVVAGEDARGGALTQTTTESCTTGFAVWSLATGTTGVLTAGHCGNDRWYVEPVGGSTFDMDWQATERGTWGDFQWHTTDAPDRAQFYIGTTSTRDVLGYVGVIAPGDFVCKYGRFSGFDCSVVRSTGVSVNDGAGFTPQRLVSTEDYITASGDSGGPWFWGNDAEGVHFGRAWLGLKTRSLYSAIFNIDNGIGVGLLTS